MQTDYDYLDEVVVGGVLDGRTSYEARALGTTFDGLSVEFDEPVRTLEYGHLLKILASLRKARRAYKLAYAVERS